MTDAGLPPGAPPVPAARARHPVPQQRPSWFRRQRWWLLALALVIPAVVLAALWPSWFEYQAWRNPVTVRVEPGDSAEYAGATWRLERWSVLDERQAADEGVELPEGAALAAALIEISPGARVPELCTLELVDPVGDRRWTSTYESVELPGGDDAERFCDKEASGPYRLIQTWVIPADAVGSVEVELRVLEVDPFRLRLLP